MNAQTESTHVADPFEGTPYANSPEGWWTEYGGALDVASGVVYIPPGAPHVPCPWESCKKCRPEGGDL